MTDNWNINGIADSVIADMAADWADEDIEDIDDILEDYIRDVYHSVCSRDPSAAKAVSALVEQRVRKLQEGAHA